LPPQGHPLDSSAVIMTRQGFASGRLNAGELPAYSVG
jgi:hypothetical protein